MHTDDPSPNQKKTTYHFLQVRTFLGPVRLAWALRGSGEPHQGEFEELRSSSTASGQMQSELRQDSIALSNEAEMKEGKQVCLSLMLYTRKHPPMADAGWGIRSKWRAEGAYQARENATKLDSKWILKVEIWCREGAML